VLTFDQARAVIFDKLRGISPAGPVERVPLEAAQGRVLAAAVSADRDYPPFDRSARDGFAVRAADVAKTPARLRLIGETRAGEPSRFTVNSGEAVEIMTGAPGAEGADSVVMVEYSRRDREFVVLERGVPQGKNLIPKGSEIAAGSVVLNPGATLDYPEIALLASVGCAEVEVFRRPRVAILSTGDEVVEIAAKPEAFQIRNSNEFSLAAQVRRRGGEPRILPVAPDDQARTRELIEDGLGDEILLLSGGVSAGKYDFVEQALTDLGAEFHFTAVAIQPGRPLVFGECMGKPVFGLPGNPLSTMVTFEVFARIAVDLLAGRGESPLPFVYARLGSEFRHKPVLTRFLPAALTGDYGEAVVHPVKWQGSGDLASLARANCYLVASAERESWNAGDWIAVLPR
jgi:molybdopterin molybdotransferase